MAPRAARRHLALDEVGSTNTVALEAARSGDPGSLWVTAERQVAGRGRRSRTWISERGNVYATLLLIDPAPAGALANLPLVVAIGACDGLTALPGLAGAVAIKWPNDILVRSRKCCGILIESERLADGRLAVVVGCGVNVAHVPGDTPYPVTGLAQEGCSSSVAEVFDGLAGGVERAIRLWDAGRNFVAVRAAWLARATGIGEPCRVNLHDASLDGTFEGLDEDGRLILAGRDGIRRVISAGDLFLLAPPRPTLTYGILAAE